MYRPERERWGNYVSTVLGERYDAFLYLEETTALRPLHLEPADEHVPLPAHAVCGRRCVRPPPRAGWRAGPRS